MLTNHPSVLGSRGGGSGTSSSGGNSSVVIESDVTNNNATPNTMQDVTGLSFPVIAGTTYRFKFIIPYTSAATTTGSRWSINGPATPDLLEYQSTYTLDATSGTLNYGSTYDFPAASNASSLTTGNIAIIQGVIKPSASGTVIARFASEVSSSAIVAKAGAAVTVNTGALTIGGAAFNNLVAMPTATADAGAFGDFSFDDFDFAFYNPDLPGWAFIPFQTR
jgi:hypothetical protein